MAHSLVAFAPVNGATIASRPARKATAPRPNQPPPAPKPGGLPSLRGRPLAFLYNYIKRHPAGHLTILLSVVVAVTCSVSTQYGMKHLIDIVAAGREAAGNQVWWAFALLCGLVAADNLSWRVGGYAAHRTFVRVTGDIRQDLFAHLSAHSPSYFAERLPGALASRISSTANAAFTVENTGAWNVLPPMIAVVLSICFIGSVNLQLAGSLLGVSLLMGAVVYQMARKGSARHRDYAEKPPRWMANWWTSSATSTSSARSAPPSANRAASAGGWRPKWPPAAAAFITWSISGWCTRS